jgi:hypothetical protein
MRKVTLTWFQSQIQAKRQGTTPKLAKVITVLARPTLPMRDRAIIVAERSSVLGIWPFIVRQHAPIVHPWPCRQPQRLPRERFSGVLGMFSNLEVKVLYPT